MKTVRLETVSGERFPETGIFANFTGFILIFSCYPYISHSFLHIFIAVEKLL